jgi:hypothetical protein
MQSILSAKINHMAYFEETASDKSHQLATPCRAPIKKKGAFAPFDPTDLTLGKLKSSDWTELLKPENKIDLAAFMSNHVEKEIIEDLEDG